MAVLSTAGCLSLSDIEDLRLFNNFERDVTVTTSVIRVSDGEKVFSDTTTITQDESQSYQNPVREEGLFEIRVAVENGPKNTYEWDAPADEAHGLTVHLSPDEVSFGRVVS